jgi:hypothetical protein
MLRKSKQSERPRSLLTDLGLKSTFQEIKTKPLNAIYSTNYKRTQNTAMPTAERGKGNQTV